LQNPSTGTGPAGSGGFTTLFNDEVSGFTSEQRRLARERIERERRGQKDDLLASEAELLGPKPADATAGEKPNQLAALPADILNPLRPIIPDADLAPPPATIKSAQEQLKRLGCYNGTANGNLSADTSIALETAEKSLADEKKRNLRPLTDDVLKFLDDQKDKLCTGKVRCGPGQAKQGQTCIASLPKPAAPRARPDDEDETPVRRARPRSEPSPRAPQVARPSPSTPAPRAPAPAAAPAAAPRPSLNLSM
jgi:hypothetical protein